MEITNVTFRGGVGIKYNRCKAICLAPSMIVAGTQLMDGSVSFSVCYSTWMETSGKDGNGT